MKTFMKYAQKYGTQVQYVWTITMQSWNIKEWKLLELQIIQTRHHRSILIRKMFKFKTSKNEQNIREMCTKMNVIFNVWTIIFQGLNIKERILFGVTDYTN